MKPIPFRQANCTLAKDQPQYLPLPVCVSGKDDGAIASCWRPSLWERIKLLFTGKLWIEVMTFHRGFPPIKPSITRPNFDSYGVEE